MNQSNEFTHLLRYQAMLGIGGIGTGSFFAINGNQTLGREESRSGHFLPHRDYCKLHIISHYVHVLLGPPFTTIPIGRVGDDDAGARLLEELAAVGIDTRYVHTAQGESTLYSFCFLYPDGTGGNMTTDNSACGRADAEFVARTEPEFERWAGKGVAVAAPEVPLDARKKLLQLATEYGFFRVATFVSGEIQGTLEDGLLAITDLLALNLDEAAAVTGISVDQHSPAAIANATILALSTQYPELTICITAGMSGSWSWDRIKITHVPAFPVQASGTAGAGDAYLAGLIAGRVLGLALGFAQEMGTLLAAMAVTSPHSIHPDVSPETLYVFARENNLTLSETLARLISASA